MNNSFNPVAMELNSWYNLQNFRLKLQDLTFSCKIKKKEQKEEGKPQQGCT